MIYNNNESKKCCYAMRDEIEQIIKDENIDRKYFYEVSKLKYEQIIRKFYFTFCDYKKYPIIDLSYLWLRFRKELEFSEKIYFYKDFKEFIEKISVLVPDNDDDRFYYLILDYGWVYEGKLKEIQNVLYCTSVLLEDFYIVSKKFDWFIGHSDDGQSLCLVTT
ncbi:MAG: hypothetical protein IJA12_04085 [Oscillospiraceae bacterium]|nr:hypothetical protein [Oscillospiraceae bacterium]